MPDEYLPPNQVLFLQNLPEGTTKEDLQEVFEQSVIARILRSCFDNKKLLKPFGRLQTPKPGGSSSYPYKTRHCLCRVRRRGKCDGCQGCFAQLQDRWRDKDEGTSVDLLVSCSGVVFMLTCTNPCFPPFRRSRTQRSKRGSLGVCDQIHKKDDGGYFVWGFVVCIHHTFRA